MGLGRILIIGILAMAALFLIASAIAALIPYAIGALILWVSGAMIHRWLVGKDLLDPNEETTHIK